MPEPAVVELQSLTVWFGEQTALDAIDLAVAPGEVRGLVGPNGAGKTTLLATVLGLVRPGEGSVRVLGRAVTVGAPPHGVAAVIEGPRFYPYLSGRANLLGLTALDGRRSPSAVDGVLERVGLAAVAGRRVRTYSLGMRQRLGLAAALVRRPRLLVLDEPTNGVDVLGVELVRSVVRELTAGGAAVLVSSHDMPQLEEVCDTVSVLRAGRVVWDGRLERMRAEAPVARWLLATSDDARAAGLTVPDVRVHRAEHGLEVAADVAGMDAFTIALGGAGIAVRSLRQESTALEAMFRRLVAA